MRGSRISLALGCVGLAALGAFVIAQGPPLRAGAAAINLSKLDRAQLLGRLNLKQLNFDTITEYKGATFGAMQGQIVQLNEDGSRSKVFPTGIPKMAISPHGIVAILIGNVATKQLSLLNPDTGKVTPLLDLKQVGDPHKQDSPSGDRIGMGDLKSVASDGKFVYAAIGAGFSSAIFKIDPETKQIVEKSFATAEDPDAMTFNDGGLYVLVGEGSQVRKFSPQLEKSHDHIDLPVKGVKGIGIRSGGEIRVLDKAKAQVVRLKVDPKNTTAAGLRLNLDKVRMVAPVGRVIAQPAANAAKRYAIFITGDLAENMFGELFWNDTAWMYKTFLACGYKPEDVFVLYGDGADFNTANPIYMVPGTVTDFAATRANVRMVLDGLKNGDAAHGIPKMDSNDTLFVWTFDHGGRWGSESTICLRGDDIGANEFCTKMNAIPYASRAVFMQQCFSGGFIEQLKNSKTYVCTASKANETAHVADTEKEVYNGKTYTHGEFDYWVIRAINKIGSKGPLKPDQNGDTFIASKEMHVWNVLNENQPETPQQADLGNVGTTFRFKK